MPDFWEFPTVSMGLGPMNAIYQARFNHYLHDRGIKDTTDQHVWAFLGDGEMDEPESRGLIHVAAPEGLDNLTFVINCNLQRLDGPVRGNGKIIQELESFFRGAGWNVIKVVWGREWDALLHADRDGALVNLMNTTPDGDYQTYKANDGAYVRDHFFGRDPRTKDAGRATSPTSEIWNLKRGGHDYRKVYAAYRAAMEHKGQPTVILAKTIKGYTLGPHFEGRNATHQMKKLTLDDLKEFRDAQRIPISDAELEEDPYLPPYYHPGAGRAGDPVHARPPPGAGRLPARAAHQGQAADAAGPTTSTRRIRRRARASRRSPPPWRSCGCSRNCCADKEIGHAHRADHPRRGPHVRHGLVVPDAEDLQPHGQLYTSVDAELMLAYKESRAAARSCTRASTRPVRRRRSPPRARRTPPHGEPMIPIYIFYSMFGFQRTGDGLWAAADQMARGFVLGATAGRTTLTGEGLQHADGHSLLLAATNPAVVAYDPAFAYEIAHIVENGLRRMYGATATARRDVFYYITVYNEPYQQPPEPENLDVEGLLQGHLPLPGGARATTADRRRSWSSGVAMPEALRRSRLLAEEWDVAADVWSVTSLGRAAPRRRRDRAGQLRHPADARACRTSRRRWPDADGPGRRGVGLDARGARPDPAVGAQRLHHARHRRVRVLRHPARRAPVLQRRRRVDRGRGAPSWPARRDRPRTRSSEAARKYRIDDVSAAGPQTSDPGVA